MRYDISKAATPAMPNLGKGTECIKFLLTQASKDMHEPLVPMLFPSLSAHISGAEFQYPDRSWKEMCGQMAQLVDDSVCNKGQLTDLVKAICLVDIIKPTFLKNTITPEKLGGRTQYSSFLASIVRIYFTKCN